MDWIPVILAFSVLGVIGLIFGLVLEFADKKLKVEKVYGSEQDTGFFAFGQHFYSFVQYVL